MSTAPDTRDTWQRIEREAREQVLAELERDELTPLEFGAAIAWSECLMGHTNGLSDVHRVGFPQHGQDYTTCGDLIPPPVRWIPLSPALVRAMAKCTYCEAEVGRIKRGKAA